MAEDRLLKFFAWSHLPEGEAEIARPFATLAGMVVDGVEPGEERTAALRKLLEARDAAIRAVQFPGG